MHTDKVYTEVGKAIAHIQFSDRIFKNVLLLVFPGQEFSDLELYKKNEKHLDRATLGKLVKILKSRVTLNDEFEGVLETYLKDRNSLVHNWDEITGWEKEARALEFTIGVQKQAAYLGYSFLRFMHAWMEQVDLLDADKIFPELKQFMAEIDAKWKPLINKFVEEIKYT